MNVKFLNTLYYPDEKELERREKIQENLSLFNAELAYNFRDLSKWEKWLRKENYHNNFRQRGIKLVENSHQ